MMKGGQKSPRRPGKGQDRSKTALRIFVLIGWSVTVIGVAMFTYSEAYPTGVRVGALTLSQLGFWLIFAGIILVVISVLVAQTLSCCHKRDAGPPTAVHAGTGVDEEDEDSISLLVGAKVNYGSTVNGSPFSSTMGRSSVARQP